MGANGPCGASQDYALALDEAQAGGVPALLRGVATAWPALGRWRGGEGLQRLRRLAGSAQVQVRPCGMRGSRPGPWYRTSHACRAAVPGPSRCGAELVAEDRRARNLDQILTAGCVPGRTCRRSWCLSRRCSTAMWHATTPARAGGAAACAGCRVVGAVAPDSPTWGRRGWGGCKGG